MASYFNQVSTTHRPREPNAGEGSDRTPQQPTAAVHSYLRAKPQKTEQDIAERLQHALDLGELPDGYSPRGELAAQAAAATETVLRQPVHPRSASD